VDRPHRSATGCFAHGREAEGIEVSLDPRYLIARETGFVDHDLRDGRHAVIVELPEDAVGTKRNAALRALSKALGREGGVHAAFEATPTDFRVATAWVSKAGLERLEAQTGELLKRFEYAQFLKLPRQRPALPLKPSAGLAASAKATDEVAQTAPPGRCRNLFAVIDHGCPFMHPLLRRGGTSTRVRALWDQQAGTGGKAPPGFAYGSVLFRAELDTAIRDSGGDERIAYRSLGYEAMRHRASHGAHALGMLLDKRQRLRQRDPDRLEGDVLFVQLPQGLLGAPSRAVLSRFLIDALVWIQAQRQPDERVILSLGEGSSQGPHDGSSLVEQALEAFVRWPAPVGGSKRAGQDAARITNRVYIAAGNGLDEQLHAMPHPKPGSPRSLTWRLPPASELPATLELWVPTAKGGKRAKVNVEVLAPDGRLVGQLTPGQSLHWPNAGRPVLSMVSSAWAGRDCSLSLIRIAPTSAAEGEVCAPSGDWHIRLSTSTALPGPVHAYIGRIKQALGFPLRTAQSTFLAKRRAGHVGPRLDGTLQGLATGEGVFRASGHVGMVRRPKAARYAARGPSRDGRVLGPDLSVRVDDGAVLQGRRSIGNQSGVTFRMNGTSVAAPLAARLDPRTGALDVTPAAGRGSRPVGSTVPNPTSTPVAPPPAPRPGGQRLADDFDG
jgi:hypothetical protein